jgi:hypothetical protein
MSLSNGPSKLYLLLIVLIGLIGGYVFYGQIIKPSEEAVPPPAVDKQDNLNSFRNMKIDFTAISDISKKDLIISGEAPVNPGVTGKKDLFAPIQ